MTFLYCVTAHIPFVSWIVSWCTRNQRMICMHWFNCTSMYDLGFPVSPRAHLRSSGGWKWFNCRADRLLMTKLAQLSQLFHKIRGVLLFVDFIDPDQKKKKLTDEEFLWGFAEQYRVAELHKALLDVHVLPNEIIYNWGAPVFISFCFLGYFDSSC